MYKWKSGKFAYKTGFSFTKRESRLQNEIFIYKERLLGYKRDSRSTFHPLIVAIKSDLSQHDKKILQNWKLCSTISLPVSKKYEKITT